MECKQAQTGLTLIEVMMTVLIIAIVAAVVLPRTMIFTSRNLVSFSRKFSGEIKYYFNQAVLKKESYRIEINFTERDSYSVFEYRDGDWVEKTGKIMLPEGVFFYDMVSGPENFTINSGVGEIKFSSLGYMDSITIHITNNEKKVYTLITTPLTGSVTVYDNYVKESY